MLLPDSVLESQIRELVPSLPGWCSVDKAVRLAACICRNRCQICVEIGVFGGRSLLPMAIACQFNRSGRVFGIDPWCQADSLNGMTHPDEIAFWRDVDHQQIFLDCQQKIDHLGLNEICRLIRRPAVDCADMFELIDLLHIDGNHHQESALCDVRMYLPKVRSGGEIWMDDADWESTQAAIYLLKEECDVVHDYGTYLHLRKRVDPQSSAWLSVSARSVDHSDILRRSLISLPEWSFGDYRGGVYNPGAVRWGNHFVLLARNERYTELDRRTQPARSFASSRPLLITIDREGKVLSSTPLTVPQEVHADRAEDFRLFTWRSRLLTSFTRVKRTGSIEVQVAAVDLENLEIGQPIQPALDIDTMPIEKNWCFFERHDQLYLVYSCQPFRLLKVDEPEQFGCRTIVSAPLDFFGQSHPLRHVPFISNSCSPISFRDDLLMFVHYRDTERNYQHFAMLLNGETLQPCRVSRHPLFSGGEAQGMRPNVVYLTSVIHAESQFWFFFGEGDEHISCLRLTELELDDLLADSVRIELDFRIEPDLVGSYRYEQVGRFTRVISLKADGTIEQGSDHDSHWKLMKFEDRTELWIVGGDEISCRMLSIGPEHWAGTWNRGSRPYTTLSRLTPEPIQ